MPAVLVISRDKIQLEKAVMDSERFTIGRSSRCDLTLNDAMLSREHSVITESGGVYTLADNNSRNGTEHNGSNITAPVELADGDRIGIGPFELVFYSSDTADIGFDDGGDDDAATRYAGEAEPPKQPGKEEKKARKGVSEGAIVKVEVTSGPLKGQEFKQWVGNLNIGRGPDNDVVLPDDAASTAHCRMYKENDQYWIEDFDSANGTFLENIRLREKQVLKNGDKIRIGTTVLEYTEVDPVQLAAFRKKMILVVVAVLALIVVAVVFKPEDKTIKYMNGANQLLARGDFEDATALFEKVLELNPSSQEATAGINKAKSQAEAAKLLVQAKEAAINEDYSTAYDICQRVLSLHKGHEEATELKEVVEMVRDSKVATSAQNWPDAILLMEKALQAYPDSEVLQTGLGRARAELAAQTNLTYAATLLEDIRFNEAREALGTISSNSMYAADAASALERIGKLEMAEAALQRANEAIVNGQDDTAYREVAAGLAAYPGYRKLMLLKKDLDLGSEPAKLLEGAPALVNSDNVEEIRAMVRNCESIMNIRFESEGMAQTRLRAAGFVEQLNGRLATIASTSMEAGTRALEADDKRTALQAFKRAQDADPGNDEAANQVRNIQRVLLPLAKDHYQQAMVHEELEQVELAIEEYQKVLEISIPGESYYDRAVTKLKRLRQ